MITSYKDLPMGRYERILAIAEDGRTEEEQNVSILAELTGMTEAELLDLPITEFRELMDGSEFLLLPCELGKVQKRYTVGEWKLVPTTDYRRMTAGQFIAYEQFTKMGGGYMAETLAALLVPEGHRYDDGYDIAELSSAIREAMPVEEALTLCSFFLKSLAASLGATLSSLEADAVVMRLTRRMSREDLRTTREWIRSIRASAGSLSSMPSVRLCAALGRRLNG